MSNQTENERKIDREFWDAFGITLMPLWKWLLICGGIGGVVGLVGSLILYFLIGG